MAADPRSAYKSAKLYRGGNPPARGPQPGTVALYGLILDVAPEGITGGGIYNPRRARVSRGWSRYWSKHAEGNAMDLMAPTVRPSGFPPGNELATALAEHALALGVQKILWAGRQWKNDGKGWRKLSRSSLAHFDHLHVEQNPWGAANVTRELAESVLNLPATEPSAMIRAGDTGKSVATARAWLGLTPGNTFTPDMDAAVRSAQLAAHLNADGIVGPATWKALTSDPHAAIKRWYRKYLGRSAEAAGLAFWVSQVKATDDSVIVADLYEAFVASAEVSTPKPTPTTATTPAPVPSPAVDPFSFVTRAEVKEMIDGALLSFSK